MQATDETSFSVFQAGPMQGWGDAEFVNPRSGRATPGKRFLQQSLGLTGMELSLNALPPGAGMPFLHRHRRHEELYLFLAGRGQFQVDGVCFDVAEGTAVRVRPDGRRAFRNTGSEPLVFVVVQAPAANEAVGTVLDGERVDDPVVW